LGIDFDHRLIAKVVRSDERAGFAIRFPQDAHLAHLEDRSAPVVVDEDVLESVIQIVVLSRDMLAIPHDLAGLRIERQSTVCIQRIAVCAA
jgi:hypothetical protein